MRLYERMTAACVALERREVSDGEGGASGGAWCAGARFDAALTLDSASEDRVAEKQGQAQTWTVTTGHRLGFHDVFRRESDGQAFRVTSVLDAAPSVATFGFKQYRAEAWEVPHGH